MGNAVAYRGDAVTGAGLSTSGARKDDTLMVKVYGMTPHQVFSLSKYLALLYQLFPAYSLHRQCTGL